jgi:threonylcarbamoyladenosine tRNA methylthiotransferase MtaB
VLREAASIASTGSKEIILTGIETASYGRDLYPHEPYGTRLAALLRKADEIPGIERIGLGSLEPTVMSEAFTQTASSLKHLLPHFHLSIQSGSTTVLNRMKRRYTAEGALQCIKRMKMAIPEVTFSADVIVGFPGETDAEFEETLDFCRNVGFLHLHIFPYSIREGTEAASMPDQVRQEIKHERLKKLEAIQAEIKLNLLNQYISTHAEDKTPVYVLAEKNKNGIVSGHSEHFVEVFAPIPDGIKIEVGEIVPVVLTETDSDICRGRIAETFPEHKSTDD